CRPKGAMAYEFGLLSGKGCSAEAMVGMNMGHYDVTDRLGRAASDFRMKPPAIRRAASRIDDEHAVAPDDEADIGNATLVGCCRLLVRRLANEDAVTEILQ